MVNRGHVLGSVVYVFPWYDPVSCMLYASRGRKGSKSVSCETCTTDGEEDADCEGFLAGRVYSSP